MFDKEKHEKYLSVSKQINRINIPAGNDEMNIVLYYLKYLEYSVDTKTRGLNRKIHNHSFFELLFIMDGTNTYCIEGENVDISVGDFILINPKTKHNYVGGSRNFVKFALCFDMEIGENSRLYPLYNSLITQKYIKGKQNPTLMAPIKFIFENMDIKTGVCGNLIRWNIMILLTVLMQQNITVSSSDDDPTEKKVKDSDEVLYNKVVEYLKTHMCEDSPVSEMSKYLYISERQIRRRILSYSGKNIRKLFDEIRCERAKELILAHVATSEICEIIGFNDEHSFIRFFKRVEGQTPKEYRLAMVKSNYF